MFHAKNTKYKNKNYTKRRQPSTYIKRNIPINKSLFGRKPKIKNHFLRSAYLYWRRRIPTKG